MRTPGQPSRFVALVIAFAWLTGSVFAQPGDQPLRIVATTTQAYDLVTILAGDVVEVTGLMGPGVDPHLYQPTESDIRAMNEADLVLYSGLHLEGQFNEVLAGLGERSIRTFALATPVERAGFIFETIDNTGNSTGTPDPHFWFDPRNWQLVTEALAELLAETDPDHADIYRANAETYIEQLGLLYDWALTGMSQVPEEQRTIVTSHDAFQYFGDAFGWKMRGLQGISTEDEAGVADVQAVAGFVVQQGIPVMFVESSVPPDAIEAVQEAVVAQGFDVGIGIRELYSDAMGERDAFGGTYIGMIAENVITVLQSYGYEVPAWPEDLEPEPPQELLEFDSTNG